MVSGLAGENPRGLPLLPNSIIGRMVDLQAWRSCGTESGASQDEGAWRGNFSTKAHLLKATGGEI